MMYMALENFALAVSNAEQHSEQCDPKVDNK